MHKVADIQFIRRLHDVEGWSVRKIAKEFHYSRKTVAKYLKRETSTEAPKYHRQRPTPAPKTGPLREIVDTWLREDLERPPKQRHTARRIHRRLVEEYGCEVAESTIRRLVAQRRAHVAPKAPRVFLSLVYEPGEVAQVDWGEVEVKLDGRSVVVKEFCMRLGYSTAMFVMLFPNERLECFLEGHVRALEFLRGVPRRIVYDNLKAAVHRILHGRQRELNPSFQQLQAHYLFAADFANPAAGWEKGLVEGLVGYARRNFFVPVPEARSLDELNQHLRERLLAQREVVATGREGRTIGELWDEERRHFLALPPAPYRSCTSRPVVVSRQALVRHQKVAYSVPAALAGKTLRLDAFHDHIEVWDTGRQVAHHPLGTPGGPPILALEHYLDVLAHKPGGVRNARVVYALGEEVRAYRDAFLRAQPNGYRALVDILLLSRRYTTDAVLAGICQALAERIYDVAQVEQLIARALGQTPPDPERPVEALQGPEVAQRDLRDYDDLLAAGGAP